MSVKSINPADGSLLKVYDEMSSQTLESLISAGYKAFLHWKDTSIIERKSYLLTLATLLKERERSLSILMAEEMGKPVRSGRKEVEKCAWVCEYYAHHASAFLESESIETSASKSYISYNPLGIILAVMPWNFPLWQVFRFAAPAVMAGNSVILKHASNVTGCGLAIENLFTEAGFHPDLFRTVIINHSLVKEIISNQLIRAVTLTGSTPAGKSVAMTAGKNLKKVVLELGGSDPYIILNDANLENAVKACEIGRLLNSGQSCISAKRIIVTKSVHNDFIKRMKNVFQEKMMGDPLKNETDIGPLARTDLRDEVHRQVTESIKMGAQCILGGTIPEGPGAYYPPTILIGVHPGMPAFDEEVFGPVAAIICAEDEKHAIELANQTEFGLGAAVFTQDIKRGEYIALNLLEAGSCFVNEFVKSDPRLPFGGIKNSGFGRELSCAGIREFVNIKTVYIG